MVETAPAAPHNEPPNVVWLFDPGAEKILYCSDAYQALWGQSVDELKRDPAQWLGSVLSEDLIRLTPVLDECKRTGLLDTEFRIHDAGGGLRWIRVRGCPAPWSQDRLLVLGFSDDITDRKQTELASHERAEHLNIALQAGGLSGWRIDTATGLATSTAVAGDQPIDELLARSIPPEDIDSHRRNIAAIVHSDGDSDFEFEHRLLRPDGGYRLGVSRGRAVRDDDGKAVAVIGATLDITTLKEQGAALTAALREKDLLVREVHHRVKNSLQIVATFLHLQRMTAGQDYVRELFAAAAERVHAVGRLHDLLCHDGATGHIDLADYLELLIDDFETSSLDPGSAVVRRLGRRIGIDADQGSALGIVLNELLTNALKYGRDADGHCHITISARRRGGDIVLTLSDRGAGLGEGSRPSNGIGLVVVNALVQHLNGRLSMGSGRRGARFSISFPAAAG